jgi:lipoprotein-releasing system permease protein
MDAEGKSNKVVLGSELANDLGAHVGDVITVYAPGNISAILEQLNKAKSDPKSLDELKAMVLPAELTVTGIFSSGRYLYDANYLLVSLSIAQELNGMGDGVMGISVRTTDPYGVEEVKKHVYAALPPQFEINLMSWIDQNHELFDALSVERNTMFFLLIIIIVVAAFSIMNTLITVTTQKTREIGVMKALGATTAQIVWVFLLFGIVVDLIGTAIGLGGALLAIRWRNDLKAWLAHTFHIQVFPVSIYQFADIPAKIVPSDVAIICVSAFFICAIAAFIPAYFAARLDPVKALRFE